jgi:MFS superfamily sulfate permease-like transporter
MIAIREAWKAGLLAPEHWLRNLVSGVIVGVVALPLAMAFSIASGVKPEQGIYTAIMAVCWFLSSGGAAFRSPARQGHSLLFWPV